MRIGFLTPAYFPKKNGATARIEGLCKGLSSQGHHVFLFVPAPVYSREERKYCTVFRIPHRKFLIGGFIEDKLKFHVGRYFSFSQQCERIAREEKIDILHARQPLDLYAAALKIGRKLQIPVALESHRLLSTSDYAIGQMSTMAYSFVKKYEQRLLNQGNAVIVLSDIGARDLRSDGIDNIFLIAPNSYSIELIEARAEPISLPKTDYVLLYNGTMRKAEGLETLIRALPFIAREISSFVLVMAGDGDEVELLQQIARELQVDQYILWTGKISDALLKSYYEKADLFVCPRKNISYQQSFIGIKIYDALSFHLPIITGDFGELGKFLKEEKCGLTTKPDNPEDFARAVLYLLHHPQKLKQLRARAQVVGKKFLWETSGKILAGAYQNLIDHRIHP